MNQRAIDFLGISTTVLSVACLFPQYHEILKRKEVVGISVPFITIDWLRGVFSPAPLLFEPKLDDIVGVSCILVIVMDNVVTLADVILNPLARVS
ncbi:hypothetical protein DXG01_012356 [Tephrocybe rancida]|nr:hypothetical protein DXG01_012356 [Tephrocybe rancida]